MLAIMKYLSESCNKLSVHWLHSQVAFQNGYPYMLATEPSLEELNTKFEQPVSMLNMRPNIVLTGCAAFAEVHAGWGNCVIYNACVYSKSSKYGNSV